MIRQSAGTVIALAVCVWAANRLWAADTSYQEWQFQTSANPAQPTVATNTLGSATATIVLGNASAGWLGSLDGLGSETGMWDLGAQDLSRPEQDTRGRVILNIPTAAPTSSRSYTDVGVRIVQFVDGLFYSGDLTMSLTELAFVRRVVLETLPGFGGRWVEDEFQGRLSPGPHGISLSITGAAFGTIVSRVILETLGPVNLPEDLVITSAEARGETLTVTWAGGVPPYQVFVTTNIASNGPWQAVGLPVFSTGAEIPMVDSAGFIRVRGSE